MKAYPPEVAEQFWDIFAEKKRTLRRAGNVQAICHSRDDTPAHIIGLGREKWERMEATDPDDEPPKKYRRYPELRVLCKPFVNKD
jgi:hypothetical protein